MHLSATIYRHRYTGAPVIVTGSKTQRRNSRDTNPSKHLLVLKFGFNTVAVSKRMSNVSWRPITDENGYHKNLDLTYIMKNSVLAAVFNNFFYPFLIPNPLLSETVIQSIPICCCQANNPHRNSNSKCSYISSQCLPSVTFFY